MEPIIQIRKNLFPSWENRQNAGFAGALPSQTSPSQSAAWDDLDVCEPHWHIGLRHTRRGA
jgi:hypothetical protein